MARTAKAMTAGQEVRAAAARMLAGVTEDRDALNDQIGRGALALLGPGERARVQRLALATLRQLGPVDAILKPFVRKAPPAFIHALLRLATVEMLSEGAPAHGVVSDAVTIVRAGGQRAEAFAGLVNAVLRKVAEVDPSTLQKAPAQALPGWLRGRLMSAYGKAATQAIEAAQAKGAPIDLTPRDGDAPALAARVGGQALPTGSVRLPAQVQLSDLAGFATGEWWVQDAAAALAARALAVQAGEAVLDMCAAPGGKTLQLAAAGARVTALDLSASRMERVRENLARCGLSAETVVADALDWAPPAPFDAVLLDAPCSATGTIRRHTDLPFVKDATSLKEIVALQAALIDRALLWVKPGGRLVYATCSLLPEEGEAQVAALLARHPGLAVDRAALALAGLEPGWSGAEGGLRLRPDYWPDRGGMDGFFIAAFRVAA